MHLDLLLGCYGAKPSFIELHQDKQADEWQWIADYLGDQEPDHGDFEGAALLSACRRRLALGTLPERSFEHR